MTTTTEGFLRKNWVSCSHCQCSTVIIGSKLITDFLNVGPDISPDVNAKPTIFEALTLIFGFQLPPPEVVMNTASGIQYFNNKGESYRHLSICVNCESVLTNLYKVFLLFTELSNGRESFILKNSIISGRLEKEEEVITLDNSTAALQKNGQLQSAEATTFPHPQPVLVSKQKLSTIRRELTSEVIAEMFIPNTISVSITPTTPDLPHRKRDAVSTPTRAKKHLTPMHGKASLGTKSQEGIVSSGNDSRVVEVITLDEEDGIPSPDTSVNNEQRRHGLAKPTPPDKTTPVSTSAQSQRRPQKRPSLPSHPLPSAKLPTPEKSMETSAFGTIGPSSVPIQRRGLVASVVSSTAKFNCDICQLHFPAMDALLGHHAREHVTLRPKTAHMLPCSVCSRNFASSALLKTHMRYHSKAAPSFTCQVKGCNKGYQELRLLRRHQTMSNHAMPPGAPYRHSYSNGSVVPNVSSAASTEEEDYWSSGIQVIHDPEHVMKKIEQGVVGGQGSRME